MHIYGYVFIIIDLCDICLCVSVCTSIYVSSFVCVFVHVQRYIYKSTPSHLQDLPDSVVTISNVCPMWQPSCEVQFLGLCLGGQKLHLARSNAMAINWEVRIGFLRTVDFIGRSAHS